MSDSQSPFKMMGCAYIWLHHIGAPNLGQCIRGVNHIRLLIPYGLWIMFWIMTLDSI